MIKCNKKHIITTFHIQWTYFLTNLTTNVDSILKWRVFLQLFSILQKVKLKSLALCTFCFSEFKFRNKISVWLFTKIAWIWLVFYKNTCLNILICNQIPATFFDLHVLSTVCLGFLCAGERSWLRR